jgi:RNA polymerase sigma factor (TIGR02999 family)
LRTSSPPTRDVSQLLRELGQGRREALDALVPLIYDELRAMARRRLASPGQGHTLNTTGVVHEAYLKLFDQTRLVWQDRRHFFAVAAMAMRQIIVDHARRKQAAKRGGGLRHLDLDAVELPVEDHSAEIVALDEALSRLSSIDERAARVVELRYFGGMSVEETAQVLEVEPRTVRRDWRKARALLYRNLRERGPE